MAEETIVNEEQVETNEQVDTQQEEAVKTFTQDEVTKMIQDNVNRAVKKAHEDAKKQADEAERLKQMNAEQKAQYEAEQKDKQIAELQAKLNRTGLEREATNMLTAKGLVANGSILDLVVKDDAEQTQLAVNDFINLIDVVADEKVTKMLAGKTPQRTEHASSGTVTKEQFDRMGYQARLELANSNPELYKQLKGA